MVIDRNKVILSVVGIAATAGPEALHTKPPGSVFWEKLLRKHKEKNQVLNWHFTQIKNHMPDTGGPGLCTSLTHCDPHSYGPREKV
jgi:hypothetical protein